MTIPIKSIPPLTGKQAERFHRIRNEVIPYSIDFSKEVESCRKIIEKSKMKGMNLATYTNKSKRHYLKASQKINPEYLCTPN